MLQSPALSAKLISQLAKRPEHHKYDHGHALVLSGPPGKGGAARLAAQAALRVGAGVVTLACARAAVAEHAAQVTAIMICGLDSADSLAAVLAEPRINALCIGPGMGLDDAAERLLRQSLAVARPTVLDADALSLFQHRPASLFAMTHAACVLTPHAGEFARLFPDLSARQTADPRYDKRAATRDAATRAGCVVLYKGSETVIAAPDGRCHINAATADWAAPWLATAGSGDVLAGLITGLLARGFTPYDAAITGAWLHVECARSFGPGLIAEDLPRMVPSVLSKLSGQV